MKRFEEVFLDRAELMKYQLYERLSEFHVANLSVTDLAGMLNWKYQATYNVLAEVVDDLCESCHLSTQTVRHQIMNPAQMPMSLEAYRSKLAQASLSYQLIDYAFQGPNPTTEEFLMLTHVSSSTLIRYRKKINLFLVAYGIQIKGSHLQLSGSEATWRYFLFLFYWWAHRGTVWPLRFVDVASIVSQVAKIRLFAVNDQLNRYQTLFWGICHVRLGQGHMVASQPDLDAFAVRLSQLIPQHSLTAARIPALSVAFFNFFEISRPCFEHGVQADHQYQLELQLMQNPIIDAVVNAVVASLQASPSQALKIDSNMRMNFARTVLGFAIFEGKMPLISDAITGSQSRVYVQECYDTCLKALQLLPDRPEYNCFQIGAEPLAQQIARFMTPLPLVKPEATACLVELCVNPLASGYRKLLSFLSAIPEQAIIVKRQGDLVICEAEISWSETAVAHPERQFEWYADALDEPIYRRALARKLQTINRQKMTGIFHLRSPA